MSRLWGLDALRAYAILAVLFAHGKFILWPENLALRRFVSSYGALGVEAFFVLSGFLIGAILLREEAKGGSITEFWKRRWWRTIPLYVLVLITYAVVPRFLNVWEVPPSPPTMLHLAFLQSWHGEHHTIGVSWTLTIEEWFYFLMPLLALGLGSVKRAAWFLLAWSLLSKAVLVGLGWDTFNVLRRATFLHFDGIAIGVLMAVYRPQIGGFGASLGFLAATSSGLFLGIVRASMVLAPWVEMGIYLVMSLGFAATLPALSQIQSGPQWVSKVAIWSYALYLFHYPVLWFITLTPLEGLAKFVVWVAASIGASWALYTWFERPLTSWRDGVPWRRSTLAMS